MPTEEIKGMKEKQQKEKRQNDLGSDRGKRRKYSLERKW